MRTFILEVAGYPSRLLGTFSLEATGNLEFRLYWGPWEPLFFRLSGNVLIGPSLSSPGLLFLSGLPPEIWAPDVST